MNLLERNCQSWDFEESKSSTVAARCKEVAYLVLAAKELEVDVDSLVRQVLFCPVNNRNWKIFCCFVVAYFCFECWHTLFLQENVT